MSPSSYTVVAAALERLVLVVGHGACKERVVPRRVGLLQCDATARRTLVVTLSLRGRAAGLVALWTVRIIVLVERVVELWRL